MHCFVNKSVRRKKKLSIISHCHQFFESNKKLESQILDPIFKQCVSFWYLVFTDLLRRRYQNMKECDCASVSVCVLMRERARERERERENNIRNMLKISDYNCLLSLCPCLHPYPYPKTQTSNPTLPSTLQRLNPTMSLESSVAPTLVEELSKNIQIFVITETKAA